MAVRLAPEIFGSAWYEKLLTAYKYAHNELEPWQREIITNQIETGTTSDFPERNMAF